jgi:hypothetical protein
MMLQYLLNGREDLQDLNKVNHKRDTEIPLSYELKSMTYIAGFIGHRQRGGIGLVCTYIYATQYRKHRKSKFRSCRCERNPWWHPLRAFRGW